ncbi:hypothetical protein B0H34DRAFT_489351 [Crassisporium funariophilum]|nr:hypothetical protein B0H34DRAFT_489351 [Crassisporium funariophilum]
MSYLYDIALVDTFVTLQIAGAVGFALIVLSASISSNAKRHPVWFSFCISWIVFGLSYSLLVFSGQQYDSPAGGSKVCITQAALVYATPILEAGTSTGLVLHLLLNIISALSRSPKKKTYPITMATLVCLPWVIWTAAFIGVLVFGLSHDHQVVMSPHGTYCIIEDFIMPKVTAVSVTVVCTAILVVEFTIGLLLYRNRAIVDIFSQSVTMAIRILIFTLIGIGALTCGLAFTVTRSRGIQFDVIISALPPSAAIIFGTQKDLLGGWMFWTRRQSPPHAILTRTGPVLTTIVESRGTISIRRHSAYSTRPTTPVPETPKSTPLGSAQVSFLTIL